MRIARFVAAALLLLSADVLTATFAPQPTGRAAEQGSLALVGGTLIDGTGGSPVRNSVVLVRGDRIERVGTTDSLPVPPGYEVIPTDGMTVLPGLWDLHAHLMYAGHPNARYWFDTYTPRFE
jgi:imidazolonepropionase-like amidohydrolase